MTQSTTLTLQYAADDLIGPLLLCICGAILLYGIVLAQIIYYWSTYSADPPRVKLWVIVLGVLETAHTALCVHLIYYYTVSHYGQFDVLARIVWSLGVSVIIEVVIVGFSQAFYLHRIWHITNRNRTITAALTVLVLSYMGVALAVSSTALKYETWLELETSDVVRTMGNCTWVLCALADTMITSTLVYYLWRRGKFTIDRTQKMIRTLIHYSISTGALTALASLVILICYNVLPKDILFGGLLELLTKLYANSVLAMLNARRRVASSAVPTAAEVTCDAPGAVELSRLQWAAASSVPATVSLPAFCVSSETTGYRGYGDAFGTPMRNEDAGEVKDDMMAYA
ncbi:hypothetical protein BDW22DRAFT_1430211 [Trametopsis cervina]|nr:hypothetical protein BDW22DRAFT_1430211 [Trametopsis cervina]